MDLSYIERTRKRGKRGGITEACDRAINAMARNIATVLDIATETERRAGTDWYPTAHRYADHLAGTYGYTTAQAAGAISALSPGAAWDRNVEAAEHVMAAHAAGAPVDGLETWISPYGWDNTVHKAWSILSDPDTDPRDHFRIGSKTHGFYGNVLHPSDPITVTIDSHAWHIATHGARRVGASQATGLTQRRYDRAALAYLTVGRARDLLPSTVQAITWVTYRKLDYQRGTV